MTKNIIFETDEFKFWKEHVDIAAASLSRYTCELRKFDQYIQEIGFEGELNFDRFFFDPYTKEFAPIDKQFIDEFIEDLFKKGKSKYVVYTVINALSNYFHFLESMEMVKHNPMKHYRNPYYERKLIDRSISIQEARKLLQAAEEMDPFHRGKFVIVLLLLTTGLRNGDLRKIKISQVDFEKSIIIVEESKGEFASVQLTALLTEELKKFVSHPFWQQWANGEDKELFFNPKTMKPFSKAALTDLIKEIATHAKIDRKVTPHTLRHTTAMILLESGFNLKMIQRQLRHKRLATTLRYLKMTPKYKELQDSLLNDDDND
jgi:integrase/recombinase XerD